jgi:DNA-binding transcriptional MerR regulator
MSKLSDQLTKRYYSTGEVAKMFNVSSTLVRNWERAFDFIKPFKTSKGERRFTPENVEQFETIYRLVREEGYTIEGARRMLKQEKKFFRKKQETLKTLRRIKVFLEDLKNEI